MPSPGVTPTTPGVLGGFSWRSASLIWVLEISSPAQGYPAHVHPGVWRETEAEPCACLERPDLAAGAPCRSPPQGRIPGWCLPPRSADCPSSLLRFPGHLHVCSQGLFTAVPFRLFSSSQDPSPLSVGQHLKALLSDPCAVSLYFALLWWAG